MANLLRVVWRRVILSLSGFTDTRFQTTASSVQKPAKDAKRSNNIDFKAGEKYSTRGRRRNSMFSTSKRRLKYDAITTLVACPKVEQNVECQNKSNLYPATKKRFKEMVYFEGKCVRIHTLFGTTKQWSMVLLHAVQSKSFQSSWCYLNCCLKMYFCECH